MFSIRKCLYQVRNMCLSFSFVICLRTFRLEFLSEFGMFVIFLSSKSYPRKPITPLSAIVNQTNKVDYIFVMFYTMQVATDILDLTFYGPSMSINPTQQLLAAPTQLAFSSLTIELLCIAFTLQCFTSLAAKREIWW